jgi:hypothetical protein
LDVEVVRRLADAASAAYEPYHEGVTLKDRWGQCRGFLRAGGAGVEVAIKGTASMRDALTDGDIIPKKTPYGGIHGGFLREFEEIQADVFDFVLSHPRRPVFVSGHSLGGAIATILAVELAKDAFEVELLTLGSPRVGDAEFVATYGRLPITHLRVVHASDIVPRFPRLFKYQHVCDPLHLSRSGHPIGAVGGALRWLCEIPGILLNDLTGESIKDHHVTQYLLALERFLAG